MGEESGRFQFSLSQLFRAVFFTGALIALMMSLSESNPLLGPVYLIRFWPTHSVLGWMFSLGFAPAMLAFGVQPSRTTAVISGGAWLGWVLLYEAVMAVEAGV